MRSLGIGLVGAGAIAEVHAAAIQALDGVELVSVCDGGSGRARALAERHDAAYAADAGAVVADDGVDAVIIATPSGFHADVVIAAAERGKHALVEKPLDVRLERCDAMIAAARRHDTILAGVFQNRFAPGVAEARRAVQAGRLGRLTLVNGIVPWHRPESYYRKDAWRGTWWGDGGGALMNQGIHTVDLLLHVAGPLAGLAAQTRTLVHAVETEDTASASLAFEDGALGTLQATTASWPGMASRLELYGERGSIVLEDARIVAWRLADAGPDEERAMLALEAGAGGGSSDPLAIGVERHRRQLEDFVAAVVDHGQPAVPGPEARRAVEVVLGVYASARAGRPVTFPLTD